MRIALGMMKTWQIYMPGNLRTGQVDKKDRAHYYLSIWPYITEKGSKLMPLVKVFAKGQPLGQWRDVVQQLYKIKLGF